MKDFLIPSDFEESPIWRYDEDANGYLPVSGKEDLPERVQDLMLLVAFTTPNGKLLRGYIVGVENVFSIGLFSNERVYHFNRNLRDLSQEQAEEFIVENGWSGELSYKTLFPLRYETQWKDSIFNDFSGVFEMPS